MYLFKYKNFLIIFWKEVSQVSDEEKRKLEIIKSILEDLKEISQSKETDQKIRELNAPLTNEESWNTF